MNHSWVELESSPSVPSDAVVGGHDVDGTPIYVGRALHDGFYLPAKVVPSKKCAYVGWNGKEIMKSKYEVLTGNDYKWVPATKGSMPPNSVVGGIAKTSKEIYIGRGNFDNSLVVGKVYASEKDPLENSLYIPYGDEDRALDTYEVLVYSETDDNEKLKKLVTDDASQTEEDKLGDCNPRIIGVQCSENCPPKHTESRWVKLSSSSDVPPGAVIGGLDIDGSIIYVGRILHDGFYLPAKVVLNTKWAYAAFNEVEIKTSEYEVLAGSNYGWLQWGMGSVPPNSVIGGVTKCGENLYIGRAHFNGLLTVGNIWPSKHCLHIPFQEKEHKLESYEVLINLPSEDTRSCSPCSHRSIWVSCNGNCPPDNVVFVDNKLRSCVARAFHNGNILPAMYILEKKCAYICYDKKYIEKHEFEVLTGDGYSWEFAENGYIPPCAVDGGRTTHEEPLYIGRKCYSGTMTMGIVEQSHGCMYIGVQDQQVPVKSYEVLVHAVHTCKACSSNSKK